MPPKSKQTRYTAAQKAAYAKRMAAARTSTRQTAPVRGRGFYKGFSRDIGTALGAAVGGFTGGVPGALTGAKFGSMAGSGFSRITGLGAYKIQKNSLVLPTNPRIMNSVQREGAVVVSHREHIGTVKSSIAFTLQYELPLNPAQDGTFPWLSAIAQNFTQYEMLGCIFEYVSTSGNAVSSTNNALGEVIMTSNANSLDSSYVSKTQMLNSDFCQAFAPSSHGALAIECAPQQSTLTKLYTRYGANADTADIRMSDLGKVTIATSGMQAADIEIGELYVNYQVAFFKPQLVEELGYTVQTAYYDLLTGVGNATPTGTSPDAFFDSIGVTFDGNEVIIPRNTSGKFMVEFYWKGTSAAVTYPNITAQDNMSNAYAFVGQTASLNSNTGTTTDKLYMRHAFFLTDSSKQGSFTLGAAGTLPTTVTKADMIITQINYDSAPDAAII